MCKLMLLSAYLRNCMNHFLQASYQAQGCLKDAMAITLHLNCNANFIIFLSM